MKRRLSVLLSLLLALLLLAGTAFAAKTQKKEREALDPYGYYYDLEHVVLYLEEYGELPYNYITKADARELGWTGGSVEKYLKDAAIGGDRFGNYERQLPVKKGRTYTECDLYTNGGKSRGAYRLIFSDDGLYFYTEDHYETFAQVTVDQDGEVEVNRKWK